MTRWYTSRWDYFATRAGGCIRAYLSGHVQTPGQVADFVRTVEKLPIGSRQWCWMRLRVSLSRSEYHSLIVIRDEQRAEQVRMTRWKL